MCPECQRPMVVFELDAVEIDRCLECGGTWLDAGELERIIQRSRELAGAPGERTETAQGIPRTCLDVNGTQGVRPAYEELNRSPSSPSAPDRTPAGVPARPDGSSPAQDSTHPVPNAAAAAVLGLPSGTSPGAKTDPVVDGTRTARGRRSRRCPRCRRRLAGARAALRDSLEIDRCPGGCGMWFDRGEMEALIESSERDGAEAPAARFFSDLFRHDLSTREGGC